MHIYIYIYIYISIQNGSTTCRKEGLHEGRKEGLHEGRRTIYIYICIHNQDVKTLVICFVCWLVMSWKKTTRLGRNANLNTQIITKLFFSLISPPPRLFYIYIYIYVCVCVCRFIMTSAFLIGNHWSLFLWTSIRFPIKKALVRKKDWRSQKQWVVAWH
jgi:hypothetical protein